MCMIQCALDIVDGCIGHPAAFKDLKPLLRRLLFRLLLDHVVEHFPVLDSATVCHKARICLPFGVPEPVAQNAKQLVIPASEEDIAITRLVASIRNDGSWWWISNSTLTWYYLTYDARCPIFPNLSLHLLTQSLPDSTE